MTKYELINKAGFIPYCIYHGNPLVLLMKPKAEKAYLPPPLFQIAKGTRLVRINGKWQDLKRNMMEQKFAKDDLEDLQATALREAEEEIGLWPEILTNIKNLGIFEFVSSSHNLPKKMAIYTAKIDYDQKFAIPDSATAQTAWINPKIQESEIREDHRMIINRVMEKIQY
jgi:hypothetical protein